MGGNGQEGGQRNANRSQSFPYFQNGRFPPAVLGETYHINPVGQPPTATTPTRIKMSTATIEADGVITIPDK